MSTPNPSTTQKPRPGRMARPGAQFARAHVSDVLPVGSLSYRANYVARDTAPGKARHGVVHALKSWGLEQLADAAELLVSELVTNAVVHTDSRVVSVVVTRIDERAVRIMVLDTDRTEMSVPAAPGDDEESAAACSSSRPWPTGGASSELPPASGSGASLPPGRW
ncbi:ATP-binding protein [Streptomyces sp. NPDC056632]|uniref:ATP-binding protein n=1 Tax=Streptomyces sp. NPDC056632 TaxID=3345884 RepID=UPI003689085A